MNRVLSHILGTMSLHLNEDTATDTELIFRFAQKQDQIAFELLLWRHGTWVFRVCQSILHHTHDAEDAFQAIFLIFAQKAKTIRQGKSLSSWLMKTTYRVCYRLRKRLAKQQAHTFTEFAAQAFDESSADDEQRIIRTAIRQLPSVLREVITLFYFCHFTTRQIAEQLKCPRGTVLSRLAQAKLLLKRTLTRRGVTLCSISGVLLSTSIVVSRELIETTLVAVVRLTTSKQLAGLSGIVTQQTLCLLEETMRISMIAKLKGLLALAAILLVGATLGLWAYQGPLKPNLNVPEPGRSSVPSPLLPAAVEPEMAQAAKPAAEGVIQISMPTGSWERAVELTFPFPVSVSMNLQFKGKQMITNLRAKVNQKALESFSKMDHEGIAELMAFKDMELAIKLESEFSLAADGLLYGVITGVEVDSEALQKAFTNPMLLKQFNNLGDLGSIALFAPMLEMAGGVLMDQAFSMRFRVDADSLSLKDIKIAGLDLASRFVGPLGAIYPAVTNGRFKKKSAGNMLHSQVSSSVGSVREHNREFTMEEKATQELQLATAWKNQGEVAKAYYQYELIKRRYPNTRQAQEASKSSIQLLKEKGEQDH